jgi:hypothetical protein
VEVQVQYFDNVKPEKQEGILVFNPPYGIRMEERGEIRDLYRGIGDVLKQNLSGFEAWIITSNMDAAKFVGLRPSAKIILYNGPLESRFIKFEVYEGSKKEKKNRGSESERRYRKDDTKDKAIKFRKRDEHDRPEKKHERPKWKDKARHSDTKEPEGFTPRRPSLGKPERTEYTGDGKKGSRKKRPRIKK